MAFLNRLFDTFIAARERQARTAVRRELLALPEHRLADLGFSRAALLAGNAAWPWRSESDIKASVLESQPQLSRRSLRRAERELEAMSDRELFELGIARHDIRRAVNGDLVRVA